MNELLQLGVFASGELQFLSDALDDTSQRPRPSFSFFHLLFILTLRLASITALKFEAIYKKEKSKNGATGCRHN